MHLTLARKSRIKVVVYGRNYIVYQYERPYLFNRAPRRKIAYSVVHEKERVRRVDNVRKTRTMLARTIEANATFWGRKPIFITFTFAENVQVIDTANKNWSQFIRSFNAFLYNRGFEKAKYTTVIEFQKRGAVHYHTLFYNLPYIENIKREIEKRWTWGFSKVHAIQNVRSIGAYVAKYLQKQTLDERLARRKAYFSSRGLRRPFFIRDEDDCLAFIEENDTLDPVDVGAIHSDRYGIIGYKQYKY